MKISEKMKNLLTVTGVFAFLVLNSTLCIYLGNLQEYSFRLNQLFVLLIPFCLGIWGCTLCIALLPLLAERFWKKELFPFVSALLWGIVFCGWVQGSFLLWPIRGEKLHTFVTQPFFGTLELVVYALIFTCVFRFRKYLLQKPMTFAGIVVFSQILVLFPLFSKYEPEKLSRQCRPLMDDFFQISDQENVILIVLDSLEYDYFQKTYASAEEEIKPIVKDFECFPRFLSMYPQTFFAFPTLLSGSDLFDRTRTWDVRKDVWHQDENSFHGYHEAKDKMYAAETCLPGRLAREGFRNEFYSLADIYLWFWWEDQIIANIRMDGEEEAKRLVSLHVVSEDILPNALYRLSPLLFKTEIFQALRNVQASAYRVYSGGELYFESEETGTLSENVLTDAEAPKFAQQDGLFFQTPEKAKMTSQPLFKVIHLQGVHDIPVTSELETNRTREYTSWGRTYFIQGIGKYLDFLKQNGAYENSWILILGDHGNHLSPVSRQFNPLLLVKRPHSRQNEMTKNENVVLMRDIAPTLLGELGISLSEARALSIWDPTEAQKKEREELWKKFYVENLTQ